MRNRPSREPALDWRRPRQPPICEQYFWTRLGTNVSLGWLRSPGRPASALADGLIPMGVWCDFDRNRRSEKTGATFASIFAAAHKILDRQRHWTLFGDMFAVDFGRLMGVPNASEIACEKRWQSLF